MILMLILLSPSITAVDFPAEIASVSDDDLAVIEGMGFDVTFDQDIDTNNIGVNFRYSGNSGNAFQNAEGIMNITNVSGDGNIINNLINLKINIFNVNGNINMDVLDLLDQIELE
jgi:hypothetical protein